MSTLLKYSDTRRMGGPSYDRHTHTHAHDRHNHDSESNLRKELTRRAIEIENLHAEIGAAKTQELAAKERYSKANASLNEVKSRNSTFETALNKAQTQVDRDTEELKKAQQQFALAQRELDLLRVQVDAGSLALRKADADAAHERDMARQMREDYRVKEAEFIGSRRGKRDGILHGQFLASTRRPALRRADTLPTAHTTPRSEISDSSIFKTDRERERDLERERDGERERDRERDYGRDGGRERERATRAGRERDMGFEREAPRDRGAPLGGRVGRGEEVLRERHAERERERVHERDARDRDRGRARQRRVPLSEVDPEEIQWSELEIDADTTSSIRSHHSRLSHQSPHSFHPSPYSQHHSHGHHSPPRRHSPPSRRHSPSRPPSPPSHRHSRYSTESGASRSDWVYVETPNSERRRGQDENYSLHADIPTSSRGSGPGPGPYNLNSHPKRPVTLQRYTNSPNASHLPTPPSHDPNLPNLAAPVAQRSTIAQRRSIESITGSSYTPPPPDPKARHVPSHRNSGVAGKFKPILKKGGTPYLGNVSMPLLAPPGQPQYPNGSTDMPVPSLAPPGQPSYPNGAGPGPGSRGPSPGINWNSRNASPNINGNPGSNLHSNSNSRQGSRPQSRSRKENGHGSRSVTDSRSSGSVTPPGQRQSAPPPQPLSQATYTVNRTPHGTPRKPPPQLGTSVIGTVPLPPFPESFPSRGDPPIPPRGMHNRGGTSCYNLAVIQALVHCGPFVSVMRSVSGSGVGSGVLVQATIRFIDQYEFEHSHPSFSPEGLYLAMSGGIQKMISSGEQCDADEFFDLYIDAVGRQLRAHMERVNPGEASRLFWSTWPFGGEQVVVRRKGGGSAVSPTVQPFHSLRVSIEHDTVFTIEDALRRWNAPLPILNAPPGITEQAFLETLPQVLVITIVRFHHDLSKNFKSITYPTTLILPTGVLARHSGRPVGYALHAVVYHHGPDPRSGHYTADILHGEKDWIRIDDENVQAVSEQDVLFNETEKDKVAYMLFYQRIEVLPS
ncbi:hypothetical protein BOTBODRAFT_42359 [Botryobasidium botryosum FD-172 SS1]|uniref:ubiquitinyl hydrolase 1 n=1 Tax=Botryobasidium botryosum (strain FD-172 SS1) TaxID=930990 RepID=A0A067MQ53_BOTB1|nr:hypothetical protein BOTBODRAFT_42359 [Botryobasidium botryosum FD-172 SS1]